MWDDFSSLNRDLFGQMERMRREMDDLFGDVSGGRGIRSVAAGAFPPVNIGVSADRVDVYLFVAGVDPKQVEISLQDNLLSVEGTRQTDYPEGAQFYRRERSQGGFRRVVTLPEDVDPEQVAATYRDGVLHIEIRRRGARRPRKIEVK